MHSQCRKGNDMLITSNIKIFESNRNNWIKALANDKIIIRFTWVCHFEMNVKNIIKEVWIIIFVKLCIALWL